MINWMRKLTKEELAQVSAVELLNRLPGYNWRADIIDELDKRSKPKPLGEWILQNGHPPQNNQSRPAPSVSNSSLYLGQELQGIDSSGYLFEDAPNGPNLKLFVSEVGMLWDKQWNDLNDGQKRKLNVARNFYYGWCTRNGVVPVEMTPAH